MRILVHPLPFAYLLLLLLAACSVREQVGECMQYALTVKAVDAQGNDLTGSGTLSCVDIYLFDETGFVRRVPTGISSDFLFAHSKASTVTLVAWGNLKADSLELPDIAVGTPIDRAELLLLRNEQGYHLPITDLFYSRQVVEWGRGPVSTRGLVEDNLTLVLERRAAGMSLRTHHLTDRFGNTGEAFRFVVRGTSSALNFLGEPVNEDAGYSPSVVTVEGGDLYAAPFRLFPTRQGMAIDLYRGETKLYTVTSDSEGNPLSVLPGQQLNVDIELSFATLKVTVTISPWGEVNQDTEM